MDDTGAIRKRMLDLWSKFDKGEITAAEARTHVGFARTVLETLKVEIAAAHLTQLNPPVIPLTEKRKRIAAQ